MGTDTKNERSRWKANGPYIRMCDGTIRHLLHPHPAASFNIDVIAYHMAGIHRYTGGSRLTNGQHSVVAARMARMFYPGEKLLPAKMLIHDFAEHVLGDVSSPLKSLLPDYKVIEAKWDNAVCEWTGLDFLADPLVKEIDDRCWLSERLHVFPMLTQEDDYDGPLEPFPLDADEYADNFVPWSSEVVEHELKINFYELLPWMRNAA